MLEKGKKMNKDKKNKDKKATLGPTGTYSEMAAESWSGGDVLLKDSPEEVIEHVEEGGVGILPIENSINGTVLRTVDLLAKRSVMIKGEMLAKIEHCLVGKNGSRNVKRVVSHPQALAQCREYLMQKFPDAKLQGVESTAEAARIVKEGENRVAVAPSNAAEKYNLKILEKEIQDVENNVTRFFVLDSEDAEITGDDKTTIIFYVKNRPGALYDSLGAFAKKGIDLTKLESRPSKQELGDYFFIVDFKGHREEERVASALEKLKDYAKYVKMLGSYPQGEMVTSFSP